MGSLRKHMPDCGREKDLICETCGWKTKVYKRLWEHRRAHKKGLTHSRRCVNCPAVYGDYRALTKHYQMEHGGIFPFMCESCPLSFLLEGNLRSHRRNIHENIAIYKCGVCDMKFKTKSDVSKHVSSHFDKPIYRCMECLLEFSCMATGYIHIKKTHGKGNASLKMEMSEDLKELREKSIIRIDNEEMSDEPRRNTKPLKKIKT